jgi:hypothetical protein
MTAVKDAGFESEQEQDSSGHTNFGENIVFSGIVKKPMRL